MFDETRSSKITIENQLEKYKEISCDSAVTCCENMFMKYHNWFDFMNFMETNEYSSRAYAV